MTEGRLLVASREKKENRGREILRRGDPQDDND
jgi:hypothetical protein